jgi:DNA replication protein DnaC
LNHYELLVLDDLGTERNTPFAMEVVYRVIDDRYTSGKPMIVTTNLTLEQLKKSDIVDYQRIYDRVLGMCIPLHFKAESVRGKLAEGKLAAAKSILSGGDEA